MTATSAVTRNCIKAHELAACRLDKEARDLQVLASSLRLSASRGGSLLSAASDSAASYVIDDFRRAAMMFSRSAQTHRNKIDALSRAPCPACLCGQRQHCESCGACPGKDRGPSCRDLECETSFISVS